MAIDAWLVILCIIVPVVLSFINLLFMSYFISSNPNDQENTFFPKIVVVGARSQPSRVQSGGSLTGVTAANGHAVRRVYHSVAPTGCGASFLPAIVVHLTGCAACRMFASSLARYRAHSSLVQGNRSGVVGCGFWNDTCGGLDMVLVWEIVYCAVASMVVIVVPFTIFYYEAASEHKKGKERLWWTATKYMVVTLIVAVGLLVIGYSFLRQTYIPLTTIAVSTNTVAFEPGTWCSTPLLVLPPLPLTTLRMVGTV